MTAFKNTLIFVWFVVGLPLAALGFVAAAIIASFRLGFIAFADLWS